MQRSPGRGPSCRWLSRVCTYGKRVFRATGVRSPGAGYAGLERAIGRLRGEASSDGQTAAADRSCARAHRAVPTPTHAVGPPIASESRASRRPRPGARTTYAAVGASIAAMPNPARLRRIASQVHDFSQCTRPDSGKWTHHLPRESQATSPSFTRWLHREGLGARDRRASR